MANNRAQRELDRRTERVVRRIRARVLRGILEDEATLDTVYTDVARRIREELNLDVPEAAIAAIVQRELGRAADRVIPMLERRLLESSSEGRETAASVLRLVVDSQTGAGESGPFDQRSRSARPTLSLVRSDGSKGPSRETD
jgi:hypothetical protein